MPGGYGTLDEYFEAITLIQTKKISPFPIVIFGKEYHQKLIEYLEYLRSAGAISDEDMNLFLVTDSVEEAMKYIMEKSVIKRALLAKKKISPFKWLFESK